jgi:hypothetical protein
VTMLSLYRTAVWNGSRGGATRSWYRAVANVAPVVNTDPVLHPNEPAGPSVKTVVPGPNLCN